MLITGGPVEYSDDVLPTGVEPVRLGHLVSEFAVGAQLPGKSSNSQNDGPVDDCVGLPVRGL